MVSIEKIHSMTREELMEAFDEMKTQMRQMNLVVEQLVREGMSEKNVETALKAKTLMNKISVVAVLLIERAFALGIVPEEIYAEQVRGILDHMG